MSELRNYFLGIFPQRFVSDDTYTDANGENGLFKRFMSTIIKELEDNSLAKIEGFVENVIANNQEYGKYRGESYGNTMVIWEQELTSTELTEKFRSIWFEVNRCKGTKKAFDLVFEYLLGLSVTIYEVPHPGGLYDVAQYDINRYDTECNHLFTYRLTLEDTLGQWPFLNATLDNSNPTLIQLLRLIKYLQPIDARLVELITNSTNQPIGNTFNSSFNSSFL